MLAAAAMLSFGGSAGAKSKDPCREGGDQTACYLAHQKELLDLFGLAAADQHLSAGTELRRAVFFNGYSQPVVGVEFIRAAGSEPTAKIYLPRGGDGIPTGLSLSAPIPAGVWDDAGDRMRHFDRALAPLPATKEDAVVVCTHAWYYVVEVTDPTAESSRDRLRRRAEDACKNGLAAEYAQFLADTAVRLIPSCAAIHRKDVTYAPEILRACATFSGDRLAAAEVYNQLDVFRRTDELKRRSLFAGALDWNGERITTGITDAWLARVSAEDASFFARRLHGESALRVRVEGALEKWTNEGENSQLWVAPVALTGQFDRSMGWRIKEAKVGAFVRTPSNCNPNRLTGGGNC